MKKKDATNDNNNNDEDFIKEILKYYSSQGRHTLPWRTNITPYTILVSEIMLQQTQVKRVLLKFEEWMKSYPTLKALSASDLQKVLMLWQGLGYQRRAKALLSIAKTCSVLPETYDDLCKLPGIGTYTASALCAFAYNQFSHPVLETNIRTVLIEFFHQGETEVHDGILYDDLSRLEKNKKVKACGARKWYYALMDFGAHLKEKKISHNSKSKHYRKQTSYVGSLRQLRAKVLFCITHGEQLPKDERLNTVLVELTKEGFIKKIGARYVIL